jgi:hypothetical protein
MFRSHLARAIQELPGRVRKNCAEAAFDLRHQIIGWRRFC